MGNPGLSPRGSSAGNWRRPFDVSPAGPLDGRGDRFDASGRWAADFHEDAAHVPADARSDPWNRGEYELLHLPALQFSGLYLRPWRRSPGCGGIGDTIPG